MSIPFFGRKRPRVGVVMGDHSLTFAVGYPSRPGQHRVSTVETHHGLDDPAVVLRKRIRAARVQGAPACCCLLPMDYQLLLPAEPINAPPEELIETVRWSLREDFDEPAATLALDVFDGPVTSSGMQTLYAAGAPRVRIERLAKSCRDAGLLPTRCTIAPLAIGTLLEPIMAQHSSIIYLLLDATLAEVTIYREGKFEFSRRLPETPQWYLGRIADSMNREDGLLQLAVGLQRAIDEYQNHIAELPDTVALCLAPDFPALDTAQEYITESLGREAMTLNPDDFARIENKVGSATSSGALMAIGAALGPA